ncbi:hypothetical protein EYB53_022305 [Candidatus Chloroploca sp. M-50]|uniref:Uncharacterized protein n=1 Tax=Candidatus Chloroploca mongolica TaxID=2528176 RepID=A0ABS4DGB1_9CHLR|nr:hypothetical protein [Candidatus Chloroploca mongolica]MBP1468462.1 hypothetical protein [Candidatus Chloroploca mongolica]
MIWCVLTLATILALLGLVALTVDPRGIFGSPMSLGRVVRGCLASSLLAGAGLLVLLAMVVSSWLP